MKYFIDTEFLEGTQKTLFGYTKPTIDLISIGIVCEDGREYYAISKDFNLKEARNRYDIKVEQVSGDMRNRYPEGIKSKIYWLRENVLKPIFEELNRKQLVTDVTMTNKVSISETTFTYKNIKKLINKYGKTNKQIANEIVEFIYGESSNLDGLSPLQEAQKYEPNNHISKPQFYAYYSDYDWVCFCWLFGRMIDLPKGFPMYCIDLKQTLNEKCKYSLAKPITNDVNYPKQTNEHNALSDAKWNFELYKFLQKL